MLPTLRVLVVLDDDVVDDWLDALEPLVMVVDVEPDVVLADAAGGWQEPVVYLGEVRGVAGSQVPPHTEPEALVAALWAAFHGWEVRLPSAVPDPGPQLTPREHEVLELLAVGLSNREIGETLQISAHTAKFHVQGVLEKLDATTRTEAAVRAARRLLI